MHPAHFPDRKAVQARALFVGERIDLRALETSQRLASMPLTVSAGSAGCAVLFRYGAVVFFDLDSLQQSAFLSDLNHLVTDRFASPSSEELEVRFGAAEEGISQGVAMLADFSKEVPLDWLRKTLER